MKINSSISQLQENNDYLKLEHHVLSSIEEIKLKNKNLQILKNSFKGKDKLVTVFTQNDINKIKHLIAESI